MPIQIFHRTSLLGMSRFVNPWSGEENSTIGIGDSYQFYNGRAISIVEATIRSEAAPGPGNIWRMEHFTGPNTTQVGADTDLTDPNLDVRTVVSGVWPASADATTTDTGGRGVRIYDGAGSPPSNTEIQWCFLYEDAANPLVSYYGFGDRVFNLLSAVGAGQDRYITFGMSDAVSSTQAGAQMVWPATGTFEFVTFVYSLTTGSDDVTLVLQINGSDTAISFTLVDTAGAFSLTHNAVLSAAISEGDLVNWRIRQGTPATGGFTCVLLCGFHR